MTGFAGRGVKPREQVRTGESVWDAALARVRRAYELFDRVAVSFSGGKDSTATLHVTLAVAHELGRTPVDVFFCDEEAIPWETVEYVERVAQRDDVNLRWLCLPVQLRNACSREHPHWWSWAPEDRDRWVRPMPDNPWVVSELPGVTDVPPSKRPGLPDIIDKLFPDRTQTVGQMLGIRAQESMSRRRALTNKVRDNFITGPFWDYIWKVMPIYDWTTEDVWTAPAELGWDYNRAYDRLEMLGLSHGSQRCSPAFGEEPLEKLHTYAECFPEIWAGMQERVPGVGAAYRYAKTELYGYRGLPEKPDGMPWGEFILSWIRKHAVEVQPLIAERVRDVMRRHQKATADPILPHNGHPDTGVSWEFLLMLAMRGDFKQRKQPGTRSKTWDEYNAERAALVAEGRFREMTTW